MKESIHGLPDGNIAYGNYNPANGKVKFNYDDASNENGNYGFREEISRNQGSFMLLFACTQTFLFARFLV